MRTSTESAFSRHEKIDICRGLLAAMVVVAHSIQIAWAVHASAAAGLSAPMRSALEALFETGTMYVMGFFVLSGYCIQLSVARQTDAKRFPLDLYLAARLTRILPLYYLGLLLAAVVEWAIADARPIVYPDGVEPVVFAAQLVLIQNFTQTYGSYAPSWSITNEVFYYLVYGVLAWLFLARPRLAPQVGLAACALVLAIAQTLHLLWGHQPFVYGAGQLMGLGMVWFFGVFVAIHADSLVKRRMVRVLARCWPAGIATVMLWRFFHLTPHGIYLISGLTFTLLMIRFHLDPEPDVARRSSKARATFASWVGMTSYPMYLFHAPVMMLAGSWIMRSGNATDWRLTWAILTGVGLLCGALGGWLLERPVMNWRRGFLKKLAEDPRPSVHGRPAIAMGRSS